jgi:hypothetical protein
MRAREFISEAAGKLPKHHASASLGVTKVRDVGGFDRIYHMNRLWMAMAMADGKSLDAVEMDNASFAEKYNTVHPFTQEEYNMMIAASKTVPTDMKNILPYSKSKEQDDTQTKSPVLTTKRPKFK